MKIRNPRIIRFLAQALAGVMRLWFRTMRLRVLIEIPGVDPYGEAPPGGRQDERFLYCLWHDAILGIIFARPHRRMAGLVSLHADGSYVAEVMTAFGIRPIRGSSGRRGAGAVREMMDAARDWHIAIATDGPRGPRHVVKDGILYLASLTGRGIVPTTVAAKRSFRPRGRWTDMLVPFPFTRIWVFGAAPIFVPPNLKPDQLAPYREQLQAAMDAIEMLADRVARGEVDGFYPVWNDAAAPGVLDRAA